MIRNRMMILAGGASMLLGGCGKADQPSAAPISASTVAQVASSAEASDEGFPDAELCKRLTAAAVDAAMSDSRTAGPGAYGGCVFQQASIPDIHFVNSGDATHAKHVATQEGLPGKCTDGPQDAALCSTGFDMKYGKVSNIWFTLDGKPVEIQADGGLEPDVALKLLKAARP